MTDYSNSDPYLERHAGQFIVAEDWNDMQRLIRHHIDTHVHGIGSPPIDRDGIKPNAIDGSKMDPSADLVVNSVACNQELRVGGAALLDGLRLLLDTTATELASADAWLVSVNPADGKFLIGKSSAAPAMTITADGNIGFGTATPEAKLEVAGNIRTAGGSPEDLALQLGDNNTGIYSPADDEVSIINNGATALHTKAGSVGIGMSHSSARLAVAGDFHIYDNQPTSRVINRPFDPGANSSTGESYLQVGQVNPNGNGSAIRFFGTGTTDASGNYNAGISFHTISAGVTSFDEVMRVQPDGRVGIGTTSPSHMLHVDGDVRISAALTCNLGTFLYFRKSGDGDTRLIFPGGQVTGILYITTKSAGNNNIASAVFNIALGYYGQSSIQTISNAGKNGAHVATPTWNEEAKTLTVPMPNWAKGGPHCENQVRYMATWGPGPTFQ